LASPPGLFPQLLLDGLSIVLIDLVLAGDNALVIAMAVRALPPRQRLIATGYGAAAAVVLRCLITIVAARLLNIEFLKMTGGALVVWIAVKVLSDCECPPEAAPARGTLLQAIWLIVVADITMSIDNVLAVAGAARSSIPLIIFGLCVSIPFVVFSSQLIAMLMDRYPIIIYLGAVILGRVGAEMVMTDPFIARSLHPTAFAIRVTEACTIAGILAAGRLLGRRKVPSGR
jgi:YjbE family integral membrane protein